MQLTHAGFIPYLPGGQEIRDGEHILNPVELVLASETHEIGISGVTRTPLGPVVPQYFVEPTTT